MAINLGWFFESLTCLVEYTIVRLKIMVVKLQNYRTTVSNIPLQKFQSASGMLADYDTISSKRCPGQRHCCTSLHLDLVIEHE